LAKLAQHMIASVLKLERIDGKRVKDIRADGSLRLWWDTKRHEFAQSRG
jgi:hypothetical protein